LWILIISTACDDFHLDLFTNLNFLRRQMTWNFKQSDVFRRMHTDFHILLKLPITFAFLVLLITFNIASFSSATNYLSHQSFSCAAAHISHLSSSLCYCVFISPIFQLCYCILISPILQAPPHNLHMLYIFLIL